MEDKKCFTYKTFKHFSLDVYKDIHVFYLVSESQHLSFPQELASTLTVGLRLQVVLGSGLGHIEDKKFFIYTTFKQFSFDIYDDIFVVHLVTAFQRSLISLELTLTLTLGLGFRLGLGLPSSHIEDKKFSIYTAFKDLFLDVYDDIHVLRLVSD